jgi:hypothetical protein
MHYVGLPSVPHESAISLKADNRAVLIAHFCPLDAG